MAGPGACIFSDCGGDPGLPPASRRRYLVVGYAYCTDPRRLGAGLSGYLGELHRRGEYPRPLGELKFYLPYSYLVRRGLTSAALDDCYAVRMPEIRSRALRIVRDCCDGIFAAVVDKREIMPESGMTPGGLAGAAFARALVLDVMNEIRPPRPPAVYHDAGQLPPPGAFDIGAYLEETEEHCRRGGTKRYEGGLPAPEAVPSAGEPGIWAADLVAGAFYHKHAHDDWSYSNILNSRRLGRGERVLRPRGRAGPW